MELVDMSSLGLFDLKILSVQFGFTLFKVLLFKYFIYILQYIKLITKYVVD